MDKPMPSLKEAGMHAKPHSEVLEWMYREGFLDRPEALPPISIEDLARMHLLSQVPPELRPLFQRYPMRNQFGVTKCNYCLRTISAAQYSMDRHMDECSSIPQVVKEEFHLLTNTRKLKAASKTRRVSSTEHKSTPTVSGRLAKQSSPSPELHPASHSKSSRTRACSSAPSSPTSSTQSFEKVGLGPAGNLLTLNFEFPEITLDQKVEAGKLVETQPSSSVSVAALPEQSKLKPTVVLKIKGNTSTTTTSTTAVGPISISSPVPSPLCDSNQSMSPVQIQIPELVTMAMALPKIELKPATPTMPDSVSSVSLAPSGKSKKKKTRQGQDARKLIPLRERQFKPDEHCGVIDTNGVQCKRSLTCKTHSMASRRAVPGRSIPFDTLILTQKIARDKAKLEKQGVTNSPLGSPTSCGLASLLGTNVASGDDIDGVVKFSMQSSPSATVGLPIRPVAVRATSSSPITLHSLLNTVPRGDTVGALDLVSSMGCSVGLGQAPGSPVKKKKNVRKFDDEAEDRASFLQALDKDPSEFDVVANITVSDDSGICTDSMSSFDPVFQNGLNFLHQPMMSPPRFMSYIPLLPSPYAVGRRRSVFWRQRIRSPIIVPEIEEFEPLGKKPRWFEYDSLEAMLHEHELLHQNHNSIHPEPTTMMPAVVKIEEEPTELKSPAKVPAKVGFKLRGKTRSVPMVHRSSTFLVPIPTSFYSKHGPLAEVPLNGLSLQVPSVGIVGSPMSFEHLDETPVEPNPKPVEPEKPNAVAVALACGWTPSMKSEPMDMPVTDSGLKGLLEEQFGSF